MRLNSRLPMTGTELPMRRIAIDAVGMRYRCVSALLRDGWCSVRQSQTQRNKRLRSKRPFNFRTQTSRKLRSLPPAALPPARHGPSLSAVDGDLTAGDVLSPHARAEKSPPESRMRLLMQIAIRREHVVPEPPVALYICSCTVRGAAKLDEVTADIGKVVKGVDLKIQV